MMEGEAGSNGAERDPPTDLERRHRHVSFCILVPALSSVTALIVFACLLLTKWQALEELDNGGVRGITFGNFTSMHTAAPVGPSWYAVMAPPWLSEGAVFVIALIELACTTPTGSMTRNIASMHVNAAAQSMLCALFQFFLVRRLVNEGGSWSLVFLPWYLAVVAQIGSHYYKTPDSRGRERLLHRAPAARSRPST